MGYLTSPTSPPQTTPSLYPARMKKLALLAALPLAFTACSTSTHSNPAETVTVSATPSTAESRSSGVASSAPTSSMVSSPNEVATNGGDGAQMPPPIALHHMGEAGNQGMTINSVTPMPSIQYGGRNDNLDPVPAVAPAGMQYVEIKATFKNIGKEPAFPEGFGTLAASDGKSYAEDDDSTGLVSTQAPGQPASKYLNTTLNPGASAPFVAYFLVPKGSKPATVQWGDQGSLGTFKLN